jgi:hypothetical protein
MELNSVLEELVAGVREALGETFVGAYLQGSFAVGDFDRDSDVDFIIVIADELSESQVDALQVMHARLYDLPVAWAQHLEGSYFPADLVRHGDRASTPLWYLDHGSRALVRSNHCNTILVRSVLREYGVTLAGPDAATLIDPISVDNLRAEIVATMRDWGKEIVDDPARYANRFYQGFIVLSYCRMLHDLGRGHPGSKRAGAEWAKATFDPVWSPLIDRAWNGRPDPAVSVREPADKDDFDRTLEFVKLALEAANSRWASSAGRAH